MALLRPLLSLSLALAVLSQPALGQTVSPLDENRIDRKQPTVPEPAAAPSSSPPLAGAAAAIEADDANAAPIRSIEFIGTQVPQVVARAAQDFVGRPATRANLKALTQAMSEAYGRSNIALFTILVPQQDLSTGALKVAVGEGYLQGVILEGEVEARPLTLVKAYAAKLTRERPTTRAALERYLSLIRDTPGLKADARLQLGQGRGAVRMVIKLDYQKPRFAASFTNRTTRLAGGGEIQARGVGYNLLRDGDLTEATVLASTNFKDLLYGGLSHSTAIGTEGARLGLSYGHLETRARGTRIFGQADTAALTLTYPIIRGYRRNLSATLALDGVNSDNTVFGSAIASERSRAARAALGYSVIGKRRVASAGLTVSQGIDMLGARIANGTGKVGFFKANGRASVNQAVGKHAVLRLNASGQWTRDALPAVERFSIGGDTFGRAFENALISADRGAAGAGELALRPLKTGALAQSEVYGFVDYAAVRLLPRPGFTGRDFDLGSAGGGVRLQYRDNAMIGLEAANTIDSPYAGYDSEWRFAVTWRLSLKP